MSDLLLQLKNISKSFGDTTVLKDLSFNVAKGEFLTLLGPSGCGKTTTIRIIAGLEAAESGQVFLDGENIAGIPPEKRNIHTIFQNYALFPHMDVYKNVTYALKIKGVPKAEMRTRANEILRLVRMEGFEKRKPSELSGGQRQRIAIARALISRPQLLLLDEPLGALDLQLRRSMQSELKEIQKKTETTFIYITHDQEEAMNLSDRIIILNDGRIVQEGTPDDIYNHPVNRFAAEFIGDSALISVKWNEPSRCFDLPDGRFYVNPDRPILNEKSVLLCVRPDDIEFSADRFCADSPTGIVTAVNFSGGTMKTVIRLLDGSTVLSSIRPKEKISEGQKVYIRFMSTEAAVLEDVEAEI